MENIINNILIQLSNSSTSILVMILIIAGLLVCIRYLFNFILQKGTAQERLKEDTFKLYHEMKGRAKEIRDELHECEVELKSLRKELAAFHKTHKELIITLTQWINEYPPEMFELHETHRKILELYDDKKAAR